MRVGEKEKARYVMSRVIGRKGFTCYTRKIETKQNIGHTERHTDIKRQGKLAQHYFS